MEFDRKTKIIIGMSIIILLLSGYFTYNYITNRSYQRGINDATLYIQNSILNSLSTNGFFPFSFVQNNQTYNIQLIDSRMCQNG